MVREPGFSTSYDLEARSIQLVEDADSTLEGDARHLEVARHFLESEVRVEVSGGAVLLIDHVEHLTGLREELLQASGG